MYLYLVLFVWLKSASIGERLGLYKVEERVTSLITLQYFNVLTLLHHTVSPS